ncbi:MAG: multidrug effflux MFS transporter [Pseudomonadota bacterium]
MKPAPLPFPEFIALFSLLTALTALSIDAMLPAFGVIADEFGLADGRQTQLIVLAFFAGMVVGDLIAGPVADALGRKPTILLGIGVFVLGCLIAISSDSMAMLLLGRVFQGFGAAGPKIAARAMIRDQFKGDAMARIMSFVFMVFILVPMLAPIIGQAIMLFAGWRAIFVMFLVIAIGAGTWLWLRQPETLLADKRIPLDGSMLLLNTGRFLRNSVAVPYTLASGCVFGALMIYLSNAQTLIGEIYGAGERFPLYFALLSIGFGCSSYANGRMVMRFGARRLTQVALAGMATLSLGFLGGAFLFGGVPPFPVFLAFCFCTFAALGLTFGNLNALAMEPLGDMAGLGASLVSGISALLAVGIALAMGQFQDDTVFALSAGFLLCAALAFVCVRLVRLSPVRQTV